MIVFELDSSAREEPREDDTGEQPVSLEELEASAKRVLGADVPLRAAYPGTPLDLRRFCGINSRLASRYQQGRVILDLTESGAVAGAVAEVADDITVAAGRPVGEIAATAVLVRPDGYVAWACSARTPEADELRELRGVLAQWFGIGFAR